MKIMLFLENRRSTFWQLVILSVLVLSLSGCPVQRGEPLTSESQGSSAPHRSNEKTNKSATIVCTTGMVADLVRNVAGELIENKLLNVVQLMGDETDPHLYKTSPGDIQQMQRADAIVYSGLHLEGKMGQLFENLSRRKTVLAVAEQLPADRILRLDEHFPDPHVWFDVALWSQGIDSVTQLCSKMYPDHKPELERRADAYRNQLRSLDEKCRQEVASIPESQRVLITAHDAFHYWGRAYGIEVKAIQGISTESEAGVKQINDLVEFISARKIKAVFVETTVSDRAILALIEGCSQSGHQIVIGGKLYSDAMGKAGTPEGTYSGMVEHNLRTIVQALK